MTLEELRRMLAEALERRSTLGSELLAVSDAAIAERRDLTQEEGERRDGIRANIERTDAEVTALRENIAEREAQEQREAAAAELRRQLGTSETRVTDPEVYARGGQNSYFRDLMLSRTGDYDAAERLRRNAQQALETRALGNTNAAGGSGGEFAPPAWMVDEWIPLIRPGRITANLFQHEDIPAGISSLNYPKLTGGTAVGLQTTQNTALASTDPTTGYVQVGFATLGGKNVASQQLLDQARNFDNVILADLARAYAQQVGTQVFTGTGTGSGTNAVINGLGAATIGSAVTWTQGTPTVAGFYGQCSSLLSTFLSKRLMPPTHWVMHPRRWYWLAAQVDSQGRPLVVPNGNAFNPIAVDNGGVQAMGQVGTFLGLPVVIDPLVPTNLGAGTNQDIVYLIRADDLVLLESAPRVEVFREPYAESLGVLFRMYAYVATILNRHTESLGSLSGTGLVAPTFAS